jgi:hypothetical protein
MPSTDWGRVDNQQYMPANVMKQVQAEFSTNIANELQGSSNPLVGGKKKSAVSSPKKTEKKVKIGNRECVVYEGSRGGKYVRMNNKFVPLKEAKKQH